MMSDLSRRLIMRIQRKVLTGFVVTIPFVCAIWVLRVLFFWLDGFLAPLLQRTLHVTVPGIGILATALLFYAVGVFTSNVIGTKFVRMVEGLFARIPIANIIYLSLKQLLAAISLKKESAFSKVVIVTYPCENVKALGFVTGEGINPANGKEVYFVFVPTAPNPTTGMALFYEKNEVILTDLTIEEGMRFIMSGGIVLPSNFSWTAPSR